MTWCMCESQLPLLPNDNFIAMSYNFWPCFSTPRLLSKVTSGKVLGLDTQILCGQHYCLAIDCACLALPTTYYPQHCSCLCGLTFSDLSLLTNHTAHLAGILNDATGALSRLVHFSTWTSTSTKFPELIHLKTYWIPVRLLLHLLCTVLGTIIKVPLERATTALIDLEVSTLIWSPIRNGIYNLAYCIGITNWK